MLNEQILEGRIDGEKRFDSEINVIEEVNESEFYTNRSGVNNNEKIIKEKNRQISVLTEEIEFLKMNNDVMKEQLKEIRTLNVSNQSPDSLRKASSTKTFEGRSFNSSVSEDVRL